MTLGLNTFFCNWILDFLTGFPQVVRVGNNTSATLILNTGAPQGCMLSVVPGQQPLPQRDQDKGDDCGLHEKED